MSTSIKETAERFVEACDTGQGWEVCKAYCHPDATFACQAEALADIRSLEEYTEWAKGILNPLPDGGYQTKSLAVDPDRGNVSVYAVFSGTHTGDGGPVPPTGKHADTDYVYAMEFDGERIRHMTKIWNDGFALRQLGWT